MTIMEKFIFGTMVHGLSYPDQTGVDEMTVRLWQPVMKNGIIKFIRPEDCELLRPVRKMEMKEFAAESIESADTLWNQMSEEKS